MFRVLARAGRSAVGGVRWFFEGGEARRHPGLSVSPYPPDGGGRSGEWTRRVIVWADGTTSAVLRIDQVDAELRRHPHLHGVVIALHVAQDRSPLAVSYLLPRRLAGAPDGAA